MKITMVLIVQTLGDVLIECMKQSYIVSIFAGHTATSCLVKVPKVANQRALWTATKAVVHLEITCLMLLWPVCWTSSKALSWSHCASSEKVSFIMALLFHQLIKRTAIASWSNGEIGLISSYHCAQACSRYRAGFRMRRYEIRRRYVSFHRGIDA